MAIKRGNASQSCLSLRAVIALTVLVALAGCATPAADSRGGPNPSAANQAVEQRRGPTRVVLGVLAVHTTLQSRTAGANRRPGFDSLEELVSAGLVNVDDRGQVQPQLGETAPTVENGLWKVFPDGRMETTWRLRLEARWHDGTPITTDDLLFTAAVGQDPELAGFRGSAYGYIDRMEAPDARTLVVSWQRPYIEADLLFSAAGTGTVPLPRHLLEPTYLNNKASFLQHPYWSSEFVGSGPFKLRNWVLDSHLVLQANDSYVRGRPIIDEIEVRFVPDSNTMIANLLAGELDMVIGRGVSLEQAVNLRDQWRTGQVDIALDAWIAVFPQMLNPTPAVMADVRFRRALLHATDRQEMADTIQYGQVPVAHSVINPSEPNYPAVEPGIVRYDYDVRRAGELLEGLGFSRGGDGAFRDASGQPLAVEMRTTGSDVQMRSVLAVSDYWQRLGVRVDQVQITGARANDREYRSIRPGFELSRYPADATIDGMQRHHSAQVPLPENNFTGTNKQRYINMELDSALDAYFATIARAERVQHLARAVAHISREAVPLPLYYDGISAPISNRLRNVGTKKSPGSTEVWNVERWEAR
jgi:peptide/nickel transport system substrate-binding protein